ncbi:MAG: hypothetical protein JWP27_3076, partial [Flaviaesturariibacter sp.]|nr:hypothetical protein [Flaviaesturariibacter sp.]
MATGYKKDLDEKQATDEKYNPSGAARDLYGRETDDSVFDDIEKNYHKDADSSQENANISKAKKSSNESRDEVSQKEDLGGRWKTKYTGGDTPQSSNSKNILKNFKLGDLRKKGPLGALIGLLVAGTVGIGGFLSPALLVDNFMNLLTNNFNDAHPALTVRTRVNMANKINDTRNSFSETSDGKCGIRCKHTTMSDAMVRNLESKGYKVTPDASNAKHGRRIVNTLTLPNGTVIHNGNEFKTAMRDPVNASMFNHVYNSKTRYFLNSKFGSMLKSKLGINKAYKLAGDSKEKFNASLRKSLNLPPITVDPNAPTQTREERLRANPHFASAMRAIDGMGKISKPTNVVAGSCLAVNTSKLITASVKYAKYSAYAALAMTYLNAASKARAADGGGIDWLVMSELGNRLTYVDTNKTTEDGEPNELYGLSATNSYGYNAVAYGDSGKMPNYAKADSMETSGILAALGGLAFFSTTDPTARTAASTMCRGADSIFAVFIQCAPTAPTVIGYGACIAGDVLTGVVIGEVLEAALPVILAAVIDANLKDIDENTKG